jgi:hypothetical protein
MILKKPKTRPIYLAYIITPLILFKLISIFIKPMWLNRNFAFAIPIISILKAWCIATVGEKSKKSITVIILITGLLVSFNLEKSISNRLNKEQIGLRALTQFIRIENADIKRCFIATSEMINFWQILRFSIDVDWGSLMKIQPPTNEKWQQLIKKLPKGLPESLKLTGGLNYFENERLIISSGWTNRCLQGDVDEVYIVTGDKTEIFEPDFGDDFKVKFSFESDFSPFYVYKRIK